MTGMDLVDWKHRTRSHWDRAAEPWDRWFDWYTRTLRPLVEWSCDAAGVTTGSRVLDVACGTGEPALTAAQRAGPSGLVLATDIAPAMVAAAERHAHLLGITNMRFAVMDAEALDVPSHSFDCCTFACGLMFCPEPANAVESIRRALRPGGRYAISVWDHPERNAFGTIFSTAVAEIFSGAMPAAGAPGPFCLASIDDLAAVLRAGGLTSIEIESRPMMFQYDSIDEYIAITSDFACGLKPKFDAASVADLERFDARLRQLLEPYALDDGSVALPATPLCASGSTP
jgi:enediyne biosynthesis protein CalE5